MFNNQEEKVSKNDDQLQRHFDYVSIKEAANRSRLSEFLVRRIVEAQDGSVKTIRTGKKWLLDFYSLLSALEKGNLVV